MEEKDFELDLIIKAIALHKHNIQLHEEKLEYHKNKLQEKVDEFKINSHPLTEK